MGHCSSATAPICADRSGPDGRGNPPQDKNGDGSITHAEFITGLRNNPWVAKLLGHPHPSKNP